jgi:hypothetical protein
VQLRSTENWIKQYVGANGKLEEVSVVGPEGKARDAVGGLKKLSKSGAVKRVVMVE